MLVVNLPKPLLDAFNSFTKFYKEKFREKNLTIAHSYGSCLIKVSARSQKAYQIEANIPQSVILLLFNANKGGSTLKLQTSSIISKSNLPTSQVTRILALLASEDNPILKQAVGSTRKSMTDLSYEVNDEFDATKAKMINTSQPEMPLLALSELNCDVGTTSEQLIETKKVTEAVNTDRRFYLDFVVLKVMKRLRLSPYETMMSEVVPVLRFGLQRSDVEPRIAYLCQIGRLEVYD